MNELERFGQGGYSAYCAPEPACCDMCCHFMPFASNGEGICNRYGLYTMATDTFEANWIDDPNNPRDCSFFEEWPQTRKVVTQWKA